MMRRTFAVGLAVLLLGGAQVASAQFLDHLKCYKVKDAAAKATYTADVDGLAPQTGCLIKVPGKLLCVEATKSNVTPLPPNFAGGAGPAGRFLCYKVKCPKLPPASVSWSDQFGNRALTASTPKVVCAPELIPTTTLTSMTTTTTTISPCFGGGVFCGTSCVNPATDQANCGGCGNACPAGSACSGGSCALSCQSGLTNCGGVCTNTQTSNANCGLCGTVCAAGMVCSSGSCALSCQSGLTNCSGVCTNTATSNQNCGACGITCSAGRICSGGMCTVTCGSGQTNCSGTCANLTTDNANCGACGIVCGAGFRCVSGMCTGC